MNTELKNKNKMEYSVENGSWKKYDNNSSMCVKSAKSKHKKLKSNTLSSKNENFDQPNTKIESSSNIKSSLSMTSLTPDTKGESQNVLKSKLHVERPYNSLKKCTAEGPVKCIGGAKNCFSWGSINSYSSSSLHSGTTLGLSSCKDDLWSVIQTNYNYIMDTNLLDSCKEARCEIEGGPHVLESPVKYYSKMLCESNRDYDLCSDLQELCKWLLEMEKKLENAPTVSEATSFSINELQKLLNEHSVLYHEIVSHARVVSSCIRAATEKEQTSISPEEEEDLQFPQETFSNTTESKSISLTVADDCISSNNQPLAIDEFSEKTLVSFSSTTDAENIELKCKENFEDLQNRYHLLYLKAFEVQLCLDGLLRKKSLQMNNGTCDNFNPTAEINVTGDKLKNYCSGTEEDVKQNSSDLASNTSSGLYKRVKKKNCFAFSLPSYKSSKSKDCERNEKVDDSLLNLKCSRIKISLKAHFGDSQTTLANNFDADSEGSDYGIINNGSNRPYRFRTSKSKRYNKLLKNPQHLQIKKKNLMFPKTNTNKRGRALITMPSNNAKKKDKLHAAFKTRVHSHILDYDSARYISDKDSSNSDLKHLHPKQQDQTDSSKFNRSNRKSKNCAIFYFKHLDTDNDVKSECDVVDKQKGRRVASYMDIKSPAQKPFNSKEVKSIMINDYTVTNSTPKIRTSAIHPPISPSRSGLSDSSSSTTTASQNKSPVPHNSIKQLVLNADTLFREEVPSDKIPNNSVVKISSTVKKMHLNMVGPVQYRIEKWLKHQNPETTNMVKNHTKMLNTDRNAVDEGQGEFSDDDSITQVISDSCEECSDSIATCMRTSSNSHINSTEHIEVSQEPLRASNNLCARSSRSLNLNSANRIHAYQKSERPSSLSCLPQLNTENVQLCAKNSVVPVRQTCLASYSNSESALDSLLVEPCQTVNEGSTTFNFHTNKNNNRASMQRRKIRKRKSVLAVKQSSYCSELIGSTVALDDQTSENSHPVNSLGQFHGNHESSMCLEQGNESENERELMKPNFRVGLFTTTYLTEAGLGSLATLGASMYNVLQSENITEDHHSSFSETAWDNYQEKYNSENYSEGFDSDAARRLMEFGDDYRNFIDSQSDCCSSVSAANNLDSMSPPRFDSLKSNDNKKLQESTVKSVDHVRRQRGLDLENEKRLKTLKMRRKSHEELSNLPEPIFKNNSCLFLDSTIESKETTIKVKNEVQRKSLDSDATFRRRKPTDERRRSTRTLDKYIRQNPGSTTSSNCNDSGDERELLSVLQQSRKRYNDTNALKTRCHLLRPEDYKEIINTCRDNIRCLEVILSGPSSCISSANCLKKTKDLLVQWETLANWSENAAAASNLIEEMNTLKDSMRRLGSSQKVDNESTIKSSIAKLKTEQNDLQSFRINMLSLNSSVHSWLTRHELQTFKLSSQQSNLDIGSDGKIEEAAKTAGSCPENIKDHLLNVPVTPNLLFVKETDQGIPMKNEYGIFCTSENELHNHLKNNVGEMYTAWEDANKRISSQLDKLKSYLLTWQQLESGLIEFHQTLGSDRGTLKHIKGVLDSGKPLPEDLAHNVEAMAKLLYDKINISPVPLNVPNHVLQIAKYTTSNGSLSDSGISDGGTASDASFSDRVRRLSDLRRLGKQLESALAPGSEAVKSIAHRIDQAEAELKNFQNTCRDLIFQTAETQQSKYHASLSFNNFSDDSRTKGIFIKNMKGEKPIYKSCRFFHKNVQNNRTVHKLCIHDQEEEPCRKGWAWRIAKIAVPMQLAIITFICASCVLQPNCCDYMNNFSMSLVPQILYIKGPPPM